MQYSNIFKSEKYNLLMDFLKLLGLDECIRLPKFVLFGQKQAKQQFFQNLMEKNSELTNFIDPLSFNKIEASQTEFSIQFQGKQFSKTLEIIDHPEYLLGQNICNEEAIILRLYNLKSLELTIMNLTKEFASSKINCKQTLESTILNMTQKYQLGEAKVILFVYFHSSEKQFVQVQRLYNQLGPIGSNWIKFLQITQQCTQVKENQNETLEKLLSIVNTENMSILSRLQIVVKGQIQSLQMRLNMLEHKFDEKEILLYMMWYVEEIFEKILNEMKIIFPKIEVPFDYFLSHPKNQFTLMDPFTNNSKNYEDIISRLIKEYSVEYLNGYLPVHAYFQLFIPVLNKIFGPFLDLIDLRFNILKERTMLIFSQRYSFCQYQILNTFKQQFFDFMNKCNERVHDVILNFLEQHEQIKEIFSTNLIVELGVNFARYTQDPSQNDQITIIKNMQTYYNSTYQIIKRNEQVIHQMIDTRGSMQHLLTQFYDYFKIEKFTTAAIVENAIYFKQECEIEDIQNNLINYSNLLSFVQDLNQSKTQLENDSLNDTCFSQQPIMKFHSQFKEYLENQTIKEEVLYLQKIDSLCKEIYSNNQTKSIVEFDIKSKYLLAKREFQILKLQQNQAQIQNFQNIEQISFFGNINRGLLFSALVQILKRDQKKELVFVQKPCRIGLASIIFSGAIDQQCYTFKANQMIFESVWNNQQKLESFLKKFKQIISSHLNIPTKDINIFDVKKGSVQIYFQIVSQPELSEEQLTNLRNLLNGQNVVERFHFFGSIQNLVGVSDDHFDSQYDMFWFQQQLSEQLRGPSNYRYIYYLPIGYYGFALNIKRIYGEQTDWIKMDGADSEWRILYYLHQENLYKIGEKKAKGFENDICKFTNKKIGQGVYFSDRISVCENLIDPIKVNDRVFIVVFQARVNPSAVLQSENMAEQNLFLVKMSKDLRLYRILFKEII